MSVSGLDPEAVAGEEPEGAAQEADRGHRPLIVEDLGVGQPSGVVDATWTTPNRGRTPNDSRLGLCAAVGWPPVYPCPARSRAAEFLDVDVDQLAGREFS